MARKPLVQARVEESRKEAINNYADAEDISQSEAIRRLIDSGLAAEGYNAGGSRGLLERIGSLKAVMLHTAVFAVAILLFELTYILFQAGGTTVPLATFILGTTAAVLALTGLILATLAQLALGWPLASRLPALGRSPEGKQ